MVCSIHRQCVKNACRAMIRRCCPMQNALSPLTFHVALPSNRKRPRKRSQSQWPQQEYVHPAANSCRWDGSMCPAHPQRNSDKDCRVTPGNDGGEACRNIPSTADKPFHQTGRLRGERPSSALRAPSPILRTGEGTGSERIPSPVGKANGRRWPTGRMRAPHAARRSAKRVPESWTAMKPMRAMAARVART